MLRRCLKICTKTMNSRWITTNNFSNRPTLSETCRGKLLRIRTVPNSWWTIFWQLVRWKIVKSTTHPSRKAECYRPTKMQVSLVVWRSLIKSRSLLAPINNFHSQEPNYWITRKLLMVSLPEWVYRPNLLMWPSPLICLNWWQDPHNKRHLIPFRQARNINSSYRLRRM